MTFFTLEHSDGKARAGTITTAHGQIQTPIFMPVGTRATVKMMTNRDLEEIGSQIILGNTYHLYLRPGHELIERVGGGLHGFMNWQKPILTDSGGFQVFSLSDLNKLSEEGVEFKSHLDGSRHLLTPEKSMEIQRGLGSDIVMAFDECPALPATKDELRSSMELSMRWAKRCTEVELKEHQHLFGIIQGGLHRDLRTESMEKLEELNLPGLALGGLSVGEKNEEMVEFLNNFVPTMPQQKPRYLMGVGTPLDLINGVRAGIDMFDCVLPTRNARNGQFLTSRGPINIKKEQYKEDTSPPDPDCDCYVCRNHTKAYLNHLYRTGEYLAGQLMSYHNLYFYLKLMNDARSAIQNGEFDEFARTFYKSYTSNQ